MIISKHKKYWASGHYTYVGQWASMQVMDIFGRGSIYIFTEINIYLDYWLINLIYSQ